MLVPAFIPFHMNQSDVALDIQQSIKTWNMAEMNTVVEGKVKYREGKKWKPRWCVMKKPSPVADRLQVILYKDVKESVKGGHPKSSFPLDGFYGLESGICFDKETSVLAIICQKQITLLAFESRETLIQFEIKIRRSLGEEHQFPVRIVKVPGGSKLPLDLVRMHIHGQKFCLTASIPPKILNSWQITDLRRFGTLDGKFCFEGGSRCGKGTGFHVLCTDQAEEIAEIVYLASSGKSSSCSKRQTSKRRSEYIEPVKNVAVTDNLFKNFQNTQVYADQNFQEDTSWPRPKRHSISFTDYRRAKSYSDKQHLMSIENVERERLMAIYDVPPRRVRKVESVQPPSRVVTEDNQNIYANTNPSRNFSWTGECNNNVMSYQVPVTTAASGKENTSVNVSQNSLHSLQTSDRNPVTETTNLTMPMSSSAPVLVGYNKKEISMAKYREYSQSMPIERSTGHRQEAMQRLQQEEIDLQKELSLLDEILQVCLKEGDKEKDKRVKHRPPPLPLKLSSLRGNSFDSLNPRGSLDNISISSDITHSRPCTTGYSNSALLSPNLSNKLKKIHSRSKTSAPLPYVNLDKYDMGDMGTNHVHLPAASTSAPDGGRNVSGIVGQKSKGYDNVKGSDRNSNKEVKRMSVSLPGSHENLRNISGSDLHLDVKARNLYCEKEPIYMNERSESPPPELPPKGPYLLSKLKQRRAAGRAPPRPPPRNQTSGQQYQNRLPPPYPSSKSVLPATPPHEENYFLMGSQQSVREEYESQRLQEALAGRSFVNLPPRVHKSSISEEACYMDMSHNQFEMERSKSFNDANTVLDRSGSASPRPKYVRSLSASGVVNKPVPPPPREDSVQQESVSVSAGNSPGETRRELIRETNYMLMSSLIYPKKSVMENLQSLQTYVSTTKPDDTYQICSREAGACNDTVEDENRPVFTNENTYEDLYNNCENGSESVLQEEIEVPFDNLLDFTLHSEDKSDTCPQLLANKPIVIQETNNGKSQGFFSRLMRRNSKDRKSISQSQENLLSSASSEPSVKEGMAILMESSSSGESSQCQSQQELVFNPKDRNRSSSFPNRSSYMTMNESASSSSTGISVLSQESDLGVNSSLTSSGTVSTHTSNDEHLDRSAGNVLSDSEKSEQKLICEGNYENKSYFYVELENNSKINDETNDEHVEKSEQMNLYEDESDEEKMLGLDVKNERKDDNYDNDDLDKDSESPKKFSSDQCGGKVFTVLNVQGGNLGSVSSCKTDDEKLFDLWHSTQSLNYSKSDKDTIADLKSKLTLPLDELSPDQKADAIARHISTLPPFVPPKMKSYPMKLSPVLEKASPVRKTVTDLEAPEVADSPVSSPALMKQQAKATLRITPPSEDEHGKIWIPRIEEKPKVKPEESLQKQETKISTLVVDLTDIVDDADSPSISSLDSSIHGEETVRSSPASTILRPRSGKEYQKVERRRTLETTDDSAATSPLTTPQSPAGGSVFTFDTPFIGSESCFGELQSPKFSKLSQAELASMSISLRSDSVQSPRVMYMNIDLSPPESPLPSAMSMPAEQLEPQLNYAEIDLTEAGRSESLRQNKRSKRTTEPTPIEYSMIDMVATRAASKARKQHALNRDGSLHRDRSSISIQSAKERMGSLSVPSKAEKKQSATSSAAQSSTSVNSTNF